MSTFWPTNLYKSVRFLRCNMFLWSLPYLTIDTQDIRNILQSPDLPTKPWGDDSMLPLFSSSIGLLNLDQTSLTRSSVSDANNTLPHTCEKEIQEDMATAHNLSKEEPTTAIEAQPIVEHPPSSDDSTTVPNVSASTLLVFNWLMLTKTKYPR